MSVQILNTIPRVIADGRAGFRAMLVEKFQTMRTGSGRMCDRKNADDAVDVVVVSVTEAFGRQEEASNIGFRLFAIHGFPARTVCNPRTSGLTSNQPRCFTILCVAGSQCEPGPPCGAIVRHVTNFISWSNAEGS